MIGITVGVACLFFLLSLTAAIKKKVLDEVLGTIPETELDVTPEEVDLGPLRIAKATSPTLDDKQIEEIRRSVPGVREIYGIESLGIPARMVVTFKAKVLNALTGGFDTECGVSGLPAKLVEDGLEDPEQYVLKRMSCRSPSFFPRTWWRCTTIILRR